MSLNLVVVVLLTHFYLKGIRIKILSMDTDHPSVLHPILKIFKRGKNSRTITYDTLHDFEFQKLTPSDIPLYMKGATPYFEEYLKTIA